MATLFYRFPRLTGLMLFLIVAAGMASLATMGRQEDPTLVERFGRVVTVYPGADARRVEALVTEPIEEALLQLEEIDEIDSISRANISIISVALREDLSEDRVEQAWTKVRDQVASAEPGLPETVQASEVVRQYMGAATLIVALSWPEEAGAGYGALSRLARDLSDRLRNVQGTEEVEIFGAPQEEVRVILDTDAAAALGVGARDVAAVLAASDAKAPAGRIEGQGLDLTVEVRGSFDTLDRVRAVPLRGVSGDGLLRIGDIARVERGLQDPLETEAWIDGSRSILVAAYLEPELQVDSWDVRAQAAVQAFADATPGAEVEIVFAQSDYVTKRLFGLAQNLFFSALIVFAVLFLMMGWRSALIVGSALPLTVLLCLFLINTYGEPLHQMSVTGLVVALGLLIDNAIVVVDDYRLLRARGYERLPAVDKAAKSLFGPLLASTLTTIFAFAPIALMPGVAGEFISMIGISVIFAVASSFILAFTVILALAAWFDDGRAGEAGAPFWRDGLRTPILARGYRKVLDAVTAQPMLGLALGILLPIAGIAAATTLPSQFFPQTERDMFQLRMTLPPASSLEATRNRTAEATAMLMAEDGVEQVGWVLGESPPRVYYNMVGGQSGRPNFAAGFVRTRDAETTRRVVSAFQSEAREAFPDTQFLALPFEQGPPTPAPIELELVGPELETLNRLADEIRGVLSSVPGVTYTEAQLLPGEPVVRLDADEASASLAGLRLSDLSARLSAEFSGALGGSVLEGVQELPVRVIAPEDRRNSVGRIAPAPLSLTPGSGLGSTPVGSLGPVTLEPQISAIYRVDGERANSVRGFLLPFTLPAPVLAEFMERLDAAEIDLPPGYRLIVGGEAESQGEAMANLMSTAIPLLILMVGAVVLAFNSFRYAGIVFATGALSVGLAMFGVWLFGTPLGFNAIVGSMGLVGLSINGTIVVLSALKANEAARAGDRDAIRETVMDATRHILATTLTTIGGFAPLLIEGDAFWLPFAAAVAGGVGGSAILALIFAPSAFVLLVRLSGEARLHREPAPA
jgi:multidrug efflux pump subunit AcrB